MVQLPPARLGLEPAKPYLEIGTSESTSSLAWFKQPKVLVAGMNNRTLRVFDLRVRGTSRDRVWSHTWTGACLVWSGLWF